MPLSGAPPVAVDLSGLSPQALKSLIARAESLLPRESTGREETDRDQVLASMLSALRAKGLRAPEAAIRRGPYWPAFQRGADALAAFLLEYAPAVAAKRLRRQMAYDRLLGVLARWLARIKVPVTPKTMIQNLEKIPALVDQQFPGYAQSGLLEWVFRTRG